MPHRSTFSFLWVVLLCVVGGSFAAAADLPWPQKNGPNNDGIALPSESAEVPLEWDEESKKNVAWVVPLEGEGHSTPVLGHGRIWMTAADPDGKKQYVYCLDAASGKVIHHKLIFENDAPEPLSNPINNYAAPSCVLEDDALYVHFGTYGTARLNPENCEVVWQRRDINVRHFRGPGSSPYVFENLLILTFDGIDAQFVTALDKHSGATVWTTKRTTDYGDLDDKGKPRGDGDLRKAYGTPGLTLVGDRAVLISIGSKALFGYDARTGAELWTLPHPNYNAAPQPLFLPGFAVINSGSESAQLFGVKLDDKMKGNIAETHVAWQRKKMNASLAAPVVVDGRVYFITGKGIAVCVDAKTGEEVWLERIGGAFVASPLVVGDRIYFSDEHGKTTVVKASPTYEVLAENHLSEGGRSSPACAYGAIYLRSFSKLYKLAKTK